MFVPQKVPLSKISDDVIVCHFWFDPPQSKVLATPVQGGEVWAVPPQIIACASQARVNFCTSTRGPANFCPKTGHHKRFFAMKQQNGSSERDQVA